MTELDVPRCSPTDISSDMESIPISDNIKTDANVLCRDMTSKSETKRVYKGVNRQKLVFYCLFTSFMQNGVVEDPMYVASLVGLETKYINSAFKSPITGKGIVVNITPQQMIQAYITRMDMPMIQDGIIQLADKILTKKPLDEYPQEVAAGIIKYYCGIMNITLGDSILEKTSLVKSEDIRKMSNMVGEIDNS